MARDYGRRVIIETIGTYRGGRPAETIGKPPKTPSGSVQPALEKKTKKRAS